MSNTHRFPERCRVMATRRSKGVAPKVLLSICRQRERMLVRFGPSLLYCTSPMKSSCPNAVVGGLGLRMKELGDLLSDRLTET